MESAAAPQTNPPLDPENAGRSDGIGALFLGAALTALWTWWALAQGAFFGTVMYPGSVFLYATLILALVALPFYVRAGGPHEGALLAMASLALWTVVSIAWTPARDQALDDAFRTFAYVAAMLSGLWLASLLRHRMLLAAVPLLAAGAITAVVTAIVVLGSDPGAVADSEGTLDYPFGYRNANAGFFVMAGVVALAVASHGRWPLWARSASTGLVSLCFALALISQSRGATLAAIAAIVVLLVVSAERLRTLVMLTAAVVPVIVAGGTLLEPFDVAEDAALLGDALDAAVIAALLSAAAAAVLAALLIRFGPSFSPRVNLPSPPRWALIAAGVVTAGLLALGAVAASDRLESAAEGEAGYTEVDGSRLTYTGGLNRSDFWRVAVDQFERQPILGEGAGSFRSDYLRDRTADELPRDAHGIPFELGGELGAPGLLLFGGSILLLVVAGYRSRRLGPAAAALSAAAAAGLTAYLIQGAVDWSWSFPALTAPALALAAAAGAPGALALRNSAGRRQRVALGLILGALTLLAIPLYISERNATRAAADWPNDPQGAYAALDLAADLNPLADTPLLVKAEIARQQEDLPTAVEALEEARRREPDEWRNYLLGARIFAAADVEAALQDANAALELNPRSEVAQQVAERLRRKLRRERG
ncbi:MAG TPA: O-antigen ligase family protein [Solirubrobacterales bacterium]|nr:O-antigen ligase family protein [Solirubrobacterales bacterium]